MAPCIDIDDRSSDVVDVSVISPGTCTCNFQNTFQYWSVCFVCRTQPFFIPTENQPQINGDTITIGEVAYMRWSDYDDEPYSPDLRSDYQGPPFSPDE